MGKKSIKLRDMYRRLINMIRGALLYLTCSDGLALIRASFWQAKFLVWIKIAQVAQSVEQRIENPRVGGSIPPLGTTKPILDVFFVTNRNDYLLNP